MQIARFHARRSLLAWFLTTAACAAAGTSLAGQVWITTPTARHVITGDVYLETVGQAGSFSVFASTTASDAMGEAEPPQAGVTGWSGSATPPGAPVTFAGCVLTRMAAAEGGHTYVELWCAAQAGEFAPAGKRR